MNLIVDASVAFKWVVLEEMSAPARALLESPDPLSAPDLLVVEIANAAWARATRGKLPPSQAKLAVTAMLYGEVALLPSGDLAERALEMALELKHPVYDCLYLASAERLGGVLITADNRFCEAVAGSGFAPLVRHLRDGPP